MTNRPGSPPATGKLTPEAFAAIVAPFLGAARPEVLVGPRPGCDTAIVRAGPGRVLAVTTDPLSLLPALGPERSARLAVQLVASDLWTSGIAPQFATVTLNLPPHLDDTTLAVFTRALGEEWAKLGVAVVGGHTGRYDGCDLTIVGSATLFGFGDESSWIAPSQAAPGDVVLMTKFPAFEATAIAARMFPQRLLAALRDLGTPDPDAVLARARGAIDHVTVVPECRAALRAGVREAGVTALHDATEGGLYGGLVELAQACGHELRVVEPALPAEAVAACRVFGIDPCWTLAEGVLLVCARPNRAETVLGEIAREGIAVAAIGSVAAGKAGVLVTARDGSSRRIDRAEPDPYWPAYARAVREGWE